jgi:hypothetical protein
MPSPDSRTDGAKAASAVFAVLFGLAWTTAMGLTMPQARAANIITFDANAKACGGAVICSTNGTTGYFINGTGEAFDLSTMTQWFQIDPNGPATNELPGSQTTGEPDMGAGGFLVVNNTGAAITSFSLTLNRHLHVANPVCQHLCRC